MVIIYTHVNVDLDAVIGTCVELYRHSLVPHESTVEFVSADYKDNWDGMIPVDIASRKHGDADSFVGAYCSDILPPNIVDEVNEQDSRGYSRNRVPLAMLIAALHENAYSDLDIIKNFYPIVVGMIKMQESYKKAEEYFKTLQIVELGKYRFIISEDNDTHRSLSSIASKNGITGTIFWSKPGCGITRYPGQDSPDLSKLGLKGWFHHPAGFLTCWGSRKAPAKDYPPHFDTVDEFIAWLDKQEVFQE